MTKSVSAKEKDVAHESQTNPERAGDPVRSVREEPAGTISVKASREQEIDPRISYPSYKSLD
ncbi:MAG TPA: hypothetical protein VGB76_02410, partial [Pyrinomonadaceae bacterium]